jgi:hypothetical protein
MRVIPSKSSGEVGVVGIRHQIIQFALIGEALESVGESGWDIELEWSVFGEFEGSPPSMGGGVGTDIDDDIPHGSAGATDEFDFGMGI